MPIEQNLETSGSQNSTSGVTSAVPLMPFSRGSEWRKWDLHVHTPGTAKNDNYSGGNAWETFISELEVLSDVAVFGVTDYWSIDNWKLLKDEQDNNHRLVGKLLIPNVELRIIPVTNQDVPINLHVLFDPQISYDDIQRQFFQQLQFERCGCKFSATRNDLVALGRQISGDNNLEEVAAWRRGVEQFQVPYTKVKEIVELPYWRGKCIVGVANGTNDGASGIQDSAMRESRCEIYRMADIIFSSRKQDQDYFCGRGCDSKESVIQQYGSVKPCVVGSDAHDFNRLKTWHNEKVTWIKADPTFDGLRQILFEPEERIKIQTPKPEEKAAYQIIDSITIAEDGFWSQRIPFNQNLVTIIGGRSSGKSTLLSCMAETIGYPQQYDDKEYAEDEKGFIDKHKNSVSVKWADNGEMQDHQVDFFRQNYMIHLQADRREIDKLISRILKEDSDNASLFARYDQFLIDTKADITADCATLFSQRDRLSAIDLDIKEKGGLEGHGKVVEALTCQLNEQKKKHSALNEEEQRDFEEVKGEIDAFESSLTVLRRNKEAIEVLISNEESYKIDPIDVTALSDELGHELSQKHTTIWSGAHADWLAYLKSVNDRLNAEIEAGEIRLGQLKENLIYKKGMDDLEANSVLRDIELRLSNERSKYTEVEALVMQRKKLQHESQQLIAKIASKHASYQVAAQKFIADIAWGSEHLSIKGTIRVKERALKDRLEGQMTRKSKPQQEYVETLINHDTFDVERASLFLKNVMERRISYNQDVDEQFLVSEFLSTNWFEINYDIVYQGDTFSAMSPGKRAFVILRLLLEFGNNECPILIDQPEDSLDNRAIYTELVTYLREKKKKRQIILVTHNPNVVVGADAEQVVVANQTGIKNANVGGNKFAYVSGSLENSIPKDASCSTVLEAQGIREHVCEILEGGEDAFKKRESKYGFPVSK